MYFSKWLTDKKKQEISSVLNEYARIVNYFIEKHEDKVGEVRKLDLLYASYIQECISETNTWLSARMVKNAFAEGYGMVQSAKSNAKNRTDKKYFRPHHYGKKAILSSTINIQSEETETLLFDFNITLGSIGNKKKISIPLKRNKHWNSLNSIGKRSSSIVLTRNHIQCSFEIEVDKKKDAGDAIGIDLGVNKLISMSDDNFLGDEYRNLIDKIDRKRKCSKAYYRAKEEIKEYIDKTVKEIFNRNPNLRLIVVEKLKNLKYKMKLRRRLSKNIRRIISNWSFRYILSRIEQNCEVNRVNFRSVPAYNTSTECSSCGHTDKKNRLSQELFVCEQCGYTHNADLNAAKNILNRFLTGPYGAGFKSESYICHNF